MGWFKDKALLLLVGLLCALSAYAYFYFLGEWSFYPIIAVGLGLFLHRCYDKFFVKKR